MEGGRELRLSSEGDASWRGSGEGEGGAASGARHLAAALKDAADSAWSACEPRR